MMQKCVQQSIYTAKGPGYPYPGPFAAIKRLQIEIADDYCVLLQQN